MNVKRVGYVGVRTSAVAGLELVGDLVRAAEAFENPAYGGFGWFFARAPDGRVYAFQQVAD